MKKKHVISIFTAFTVTLTLTLFANNFDFVKFKTLGSAYDEINCNYYFDSENNYTSIYQIVDNLNNGNTEIYYKTWGTVTKHSLALMDIKVFIFKALINIKIPLAF